MAPQRLVVFTPLPPMPTGIGDYAEEILRPLSRLYDCTVVVEDGRTGLRAPPGVRIIEAFAYRRDQAAWADALHVYHIGNNPDHVYMLPFLWQRPGLVVLHDPSLHNLADSATAALGDLDGYAQALETEYGAPGGVLAAQFRRHGLREPRMHYDMPMIRTLCGRALGVVVHSQYAAAKVLAQAPEAQVTVVPHQFSPPAGDGTADGPAALRAALGVAPGELVFMSLGFASRVKAIDVALRALARIRDALPPFRYVIAGKLVREDLDVPAMAASLGLADRVTVTGYLDEARFFPTVRAADIVVNLRHPIGGETSGTLIRALGSGACVVVVDRGPFAEIPDGAAAKIPWDDGFEDRLAAELLALARDPARRRALGAAARAHTRTVNSLQATAAGYVRAIAAAASRPVLPWAVQTEWRFPTPHAHAARVAAARAAGAGPLPLWFTLGAVPRAATPCRALLAGGDSDADLLRGALGQAAERMSVDAFLGGGAARRGYDLVLVAAPAPRADMVLLHRLNAALRFGGIAVVQVETTDAEATASSPFFHRAAGEALFAAAGFRLDAAAPTPPVEIDLPAETGSGRAVYCWSATKVSEFIARPSEEAA